MGVALVRDAYDGRVDGIQATSAYAWPSSTDREKRVPATVAVESKQMETRLRSTRRTIASGE
jgi:hypothetical protein